MVKIIGASPRAAFLAPRTMSSPAPAQQIETGGSADAALAELSRAVKEAGRAHGGRVAKTKSVQPSPIDFTTLSLEGWRSKGAQTMFRQKNGRLYFTDGRDVARRTS
eukprot:6201823-Pleurochrysis_carterae.AAC.2